MAAESVKYARLLTLRDKKTLSQKALKVGEECGELAKWVLPFEGAHATTHRFIDRSRILEEVCDVVLTSTSIAYELGFSDEEIEAMLMRKLLKWDELQVREDKAKYPVPYELHVTVKEAAVGLFKAVCAALGVKPILLDLHLADGGMMKDMMTSSVHLGDNPSALAELNRIANGLRAAGYDVVREKIETVPWHPAAPSNEHAEPVMPKDCYFECHLNVLCSDAKRAQLGEIAAKAGFHMSRNVFKRIDADTFTIMLTLRRYSGTREAFRAELDAAKSLFAASGFEVEKEIVEFSVYDTHVRHDRAWIGPAAA